MPALNIFNPSFGDVLFSSGHCICSFLGISPIFIARLLVCQQKQFLRVMVIVIVSHF